MSGNRGRGSGRVKQEFPEKKYEERKPKGKIRTEEIPHTNLMQTSTTSLVKDEASTSSMQIIDPTKVSAKQLKALGQSKKVPKIISTTVLRSAISNERLHENADFYSTLSSSTVMEKKTQNNQGSLDGITEDNLLHSPVVDNLNLNMEMIVDLPSVAQEQEPNDKPDSSKSSDVDLDEEIHDDLAVTPEQIFAFTEDKAHDELELDDTMGEYIGFVESEMVRQTTPNNGDVAHIVLNNNSQRKMMICAWNESIRLIEEVATIGNVVEASGLLVKKKEDKRYNKSSGDLFFEVQGFSRFQILGVLENLPEDCGISKVDFDTLSQFSGIIKIEGYVKTAPRLFNSHLFPAKIVGGITDGKKVVEINLPKGEIVDHIQKGEYVKVIGSVIKKGNGLHIIKVDSKNDIVKLPCEDNHILTWFTAAYQHV